MDDTREDMEAYWDVIVGTETIIALPVGQLEKRQAYQPPDAERRTEGGQP